ncbi:MAG: methylated-DNA--[protein]-cysteine S-methyltransferase [Candidatus Hermodarchaeota archaeon]
MKIFILLSYKYLKNKKKLKLEELNIFKNEQEVLDYIKLNNLISTSKNMDNEIMILSQIENLVLNYLQGQKLNLYKEIKKFDVELDLKDKFKTDFSRKVIETLLTIKPGEVTTYHDIGKKISTKAFRAVGNVCKANPIPLIIPCHRVLRKNGEIGGFMGKSDKTWETNLKKQLLKLEGYKI